MEPVTLPGAITTVLAAVASVGGTVLYFRRQLSKDSTEIAADKGAANLIDDLQKERDDALEEARRARDDASVVREKRIDDAQRIARLEATNEYLIRENDRLLGDVRRFVRGLPEETQRVLATDFAGLDDERRK